MEIKAELLKPYTDEQRVEFIVEQNHSNGYVIEEQELGLVALGLTEEEKAEQQKEQRKQEIISELDKLDLKSIRALRANDIEYIDKYEMEVQELRKELNKLNGIEVEIEDGLQQQQEKERISKLTMTSLDLIGYLQNVGLTLEQINNFLESNLPLKMQLTYCQNVYCGVVCQLCPLTIGELEITEDKVISWFLDKNN